MWIGAPPVKAMAESSLFVVSMYTAYPSFVTASRTMVLDATSCVPLGAMVPGGRPASKA